MEGDRGGGVGCVREVGEEGAGSEILKVAGRGKYKGNDATLHKILHKEVVGNKNRAGTGIKGYGKWEV